MKETYMTPEAELLRLAPYPKLAMLEDWEGGNDLETKESEEDIDIPLE